jgi:hypothetical protein
MPRSSLLTAAIVGLALLPTVAVAQEPSAPKDDRNRLTAEQVAATELPTVYEVVDRLRRRWFKDPLSGKAVTVYQEGRKLGDRAALKEIPAQEVELLEYIDGLTAIRRWGQEAEGGAIVVTLKAR